MRRLFLTLALLAFPAALYAQVAHDTCSESHTGAGGSMSEASFTWTHTPIGTPRGVLVYTFVVANATDHTTGVTYDGEALTAVTGGIATLATGEVAVVKAYFKGSSVNTGAVSVVVNRTNDGQFMYAIACTVTAGGDTEVYEAGIVVISNDNIDLDEQSVTDGSPGTNSVRYAGIQSGNGAVPTPGANSTATVDLDSGSETSAVVRETTAGQGARLIGWDYGGPPDDAAAVHLAVRQAGGGGGGATPKCVGGLLGVGCE